MYVCKYVMGTYMDGEASKNEDAQVADSEEVCMYACCGCMYVVYVCMYVSTNTAAAWMYPSDLSFSIYVSIRLSIHRRMKKKAKRLLLLLLLLLLTRLRDLMRDHIQGKASFISIHT